MPTSTRKLLLNDKTIVIISRWNKRLQMHILKIFAISSMQRTRYLHLSIVVLEQLLEYYNFLLRYLDFEISTINLT